MSAVSSTAVLMPGPESARTRPLPTSQGQWPFGPSGPLAVLSSTLEPRPSPGVSVFCPFGASLAMCRGHSCSVPGGSLPVTCGAGPSGQSACQASRAHFCLHDTIKLLQTTSLGARELVQWVGHTPGTHPTGPRGSISGTTQGPSSTGRGHSVESQK